MRSGDLLRFFLAFGRWKDAPTSRYYHRDLEKLMEMHEAIALADATRRRAGRPRLEGGPATRAGRKLFPAHEHMCGHACRCDDPERPLCSVCERESEDV